MGILQPMETMIQDMDEWELTIKNQAPVVFSGVSFLEDCCQHLDLDVITSYTPGDFLVNETEILKLRGFLSGIMVFREEFVNQWSNLLNICTVLYRMKIAIGKNSPGMKIVVRNLPDMIYNTLYLNETIEDAGCIFWPMAVTDGIIHQPIWKRYVDIKQAIDSFKKRLYPGMKVLLECDNISDSIEAMKNGADGIILRNMREDIVAEISKTIRERFKKVYLEYMGDVRLSNIEGYGKSGIDAIGIDDITFLFGRANLKIEIKKVSNMRHDEQ
ncbi:MAG: hypothetical protein ACLFQE_03495 [Thermotogota bacterium]